VAGVVQADPAPLSCPTILPHYLAGERGFPPVGVERMLRIYLMQQWFNLSDPAAEEAA
jgi:IS5 family transposase